MKKHPEYPPGLTGEQANELICLAEHHIGCGTDRKRRNVKIKDLPRKFQARAKPDTRTLKEMMSQHDSYLQSRGWKPIKLIPDWVLFLVAIFVSLGIGGIIYALIMLFYA